jgi:putative nucleotidyltransferase with HDIG domain
MQGFTVGKKGTYLERVKYDTNEISLLSRGDGVEIMTQSIKKGRLFYAYPAENAKSLEFFYVLSGEMLCEMNDSKVTISSEEYIRIQNLAEPIHFQAISDVRLLWISTEPFFRQISSEISSLMDIVKQVEKKDCYTIKHSDRVANYSAKIAKKMKFNKEQLERLSLSACLHDIGKINVPEEILNKPGRLTNEEYDIIKKHPTDGAEMLKDTNYTELMPIIEQHHERLNGSGYPHGLKGDEIVIEAQIIAVADTFDAMTEDRAYRRALANDYAIKEIKSLVGTHFNKEIVKVFEEILIEDGLITEKKE